MVLAVLPLQARKYAQQEVRIGDCSFVPEANVPSHYDEACGA